MIRPPASGKETVAGISAIVSLHGREAPIDTGI